MKASRKQAAGSTHIAAGDGQQPRKHASGSRHASRLQVVVRRKADAAARGAELIAARSSAQKREAAARDRQHWETRSYRQALAGRTAAGG